MTANRDAISDGVTVKRLERGFRWPEDRKAAIVFNIAFEGWSDGVAPGIGPMGNPLPPGAFDTNALSWGTYGQTRGIERLLRILEQRHIAASVMTSGIFALRAPDIVKAISAAGHEIVAHGFAQDIIPAKLAAEEVNKDIVKTTEALASVSGKRPAGWISPRGTPHPQSTKFLLDSGYIWHGDVFDDDRPYFQFHGGRHIVAIPLTMEINDLPHAMRFGQSPRQFVEKFEDLLAFAISGESEATIIDVTAHAHVYGRTAGAWAIDEIARTALECKAAWITTREAMAACLNSVAL
ncbi:MAG: polysaccharide deacetylase family protein [Rhodomicrobium sp.]